MANKTNQANQNPDRNDNTNVITPQQSTSVIASTILGVGVLTLPRYTAEAREAAWLVLILSGLLTLFAIYIITKLGQRFPNRTIVDYSAHILGSRRVAWIGKGLAAPISILFIVFWFVATAVITRTFGEVIVTTVLRNTPLEVIILTMLLATLCFIMFEVEVLARFNEILFPFIIVPGLFIAAVSFQNARIDNLLPLFTIDWATFLKSVFKTSAAYLGFSVIILFMAYSQDNGKIVKANLTGVGIPAFVYVIVNLAGLAVFGYEELNLLVWPTLELVKSVEFPGLILERVESLFLAIWVAAVYTTVGNLFYASCMATAQFLPFRRKDTARRWIAVLFLPLLYIIALQPQNIFELFSWLEMIGYVGFFASYMLPLILYILALIRRKGRKTKQHESKPSA